jgi:SAM-dependent methyltransferase
MPYSSSFYEQTQLGGIDGALTVLGHVRELVPVTSAVDFGCGTGGWLSALSTLGVDEVLGIDGDWVPQKMLKIPRSRFLVHDLTKPFELERNFDLAISLEVAEHLPDTSASDFVAMLVDAAPVVLFSAAIPGQGGTGHINEQWPDYWVERFRARGYDVIDAIRPLIWNDSSIASCIRQNVLLFASKQAIDGSGSLTTARNSASENQLALVHPEEFANVTDPVRMSFRRTIKTLPAVGLATLRRRVGRR